MIHARNIVHHLIFHQTEWHFSNISICFGWNTFGIAIDHLTNNSPHNLIVYPELLWLHARSSSYLFLFRCELCYWFRRREILLLLRLQLGPENFIKICCFSNCFHVTHLLLPLQEQAGAFDKLSRLHRICNRFFFFNIKTQTLALSYLSKVI